MFCSVMYVLANSKVYPLQSPIDVLWRALIFLLYFGDDYRMSLYSCHWLCHISLTHPLAAAQALADVGPRRPKPVLDIFAGFK